MLLKMTKDIFNILLNSVLLNTELYWGGSFKRLVIIILVVTPKDP